MKLTVRDKFWLRALIVYWAILPVLVLFSSPQWIVRTNVWVLLLVAIGNGLLWLVLAIALAAVNRAPAIGPLPRFVPGRSRGRERN